MKPNCPLKVALPIPQPTGYKASNRDYKLQLSLDGMPLPSVLLLLSGSIYQDVLYCLPALAGDRLFTPWLKLIGKRAPMPPYLHVEIAHSGPAIIGVKAKVGWLLHTLYDDNICQPIRARTASLVATKPSGLPCYSGNG